MQIFAFLEMSVRQNQRVRTVNVLLENRYKVSYACEFIIFAIEEFRVSEFSI